MSKRDEGLAVKIGTVVLSLAAGWLAQKAVALIWEKSTGHAAPQGPDDEEATITQAVAFAAISGAVAVLARRLSHQGALRASARYAAKHIDS